MTKPTKWLCGQRRCKSAWAFARSDHSLQCALIKESSFLHADSDDWSNSKDAQADLSLHWAHKPFCWFCHEGARIWYVLSLFEDDSSTSYGGRQQFSSAGAIFYDGYQYKLTLQYCQNCWPRVNLHFRLETDHKLKSHWQKSKMHAATNHVQI